MGKSKVIVWQIGLQLFAQKPVDGFDRITDLRVIDGVMHILSVFVGYQYAGILQYSKVLGSNGLLNLERVVDLVDLDVLVLIQKFEDLKTEGVSQSPHKFCRHRKLLLLKGDLSPFHTFPILS